MKLDYQFQDLALIIGCLALAVMSTTALITVLCRRRQARPVKPWLKAMLSSMAHADQHKGKLNPARLPMEKL